MRVGIYTHYAHCDQTYLTLRLAQLFHKLNIEYEIYSDKPPARLFVPQDKYVITRQQLKFTDWAKRQNVIIWTQVPRSEQIAYVKRRGIKTILVPMWQELLQPFRKSLRAADAVVSMSAESQTLFDEVYKVKNAELIPFDTGLPIHKKSNFVNPRKIKILLPWFDRNAKCTGGQFITVIKDIMLHMEEAYLTVAVTPSHFSPGISKFLLNLQKRIPGRLSILRRVPVKKRADIYAENDLTLIPSECDNYGLCALTSITMGTPVIAAAISPQIDFLHPDVNSSLILTKTDYDENGVVHALPDYEVFGFVLQTLLTDPNLINKMNQKTNHNLNTRRHHFESSWAAILNT